MSETVLRATGLGFAGVVVARATPRGSRDAGLDGFPERFVFTSPMPFELAWACRDDRLDVSLVGEFDLWSSSVLEPLLCALMARCRCRRVVVDLSGVAFMDGHGVGFLVRSRGLARELGYELSWKRPSPAAERVLDICGVRA
jgi:anti-anti-sigma factor